MAGCTVDIDPVLDDALLAEILKEERLEPAEVAVESRQGEYVEFGSGPYRGGGKSPDRDVRGEFIKWAKAKFGDTAESVAFALRVYAKVMNEGMPPQPFIRPALMDVLNELDDTWFEEHTVLDLAQEIVDRSREYLIANNTPATGELENSIRAYLAREDSEFMGGLPDEIWRSRELARDGNRRREFRR